MIEIDRAALPETTVYRAITSKHLGGAPEQVEVGTTLQVVGFPSASTTRCAICQSCAMPG